MVPHIENHEDSFNDLIDLENRLRNIRPRAPQLELARIGSQVELSSTSSLEPKLRSIKSSWTFAGSMAASLAVGLLIGAGGMSYSLQRNGFGGVDTSPTMGVKQDNLSTSSDLAKDAMRSGQNIEEAPSWTRPSSDIENILEASMDSEFGEILRAGEHLLIARSKMISTSSQVNNPSVNEQPWSSTDLGSESDVLPSTSSRLMRDFLKWKDTH